MGREPLVVLVVDADLDHANMVAAALQGEGHDVRIAASGGDSLELARAAYFDCVLLDLCTPDGECFDVARQLRNDVLAIHSAIILLTSARTLSIQRADASGIDLILTKPISTELLSGLIRQVQSVRQRTVSPPRGGSRQ